PCSHGGKRDSSRSSACHVPESIPGAHKDRRISSAGLFRTYVWQNGMEIAALRGVPCVECQELLSTWRGSLMPLTCHSPIRRLLMTTDTVGSVWAYALDLGQALQEYGIDIALATLGPPLDAQQRAAVRQIKNLTVFESTCKLEWMEAPWDDVAAAGVWLLELEAQTQPDVVHLNGYAHGGLPWQLPTLMVGYTCVFSWIIAVKRALPSVAWERYRREVTRGLRAAELVTAPTAAMLTALRMHYGTFAAAPPIYHGRRAASFPPMLKEPCILTAGCVWD